MPRVYLSQAERDKAREKARDERRRQKLDEMIRGKMQVKGITQADLGEKLEITQQAVGKKIRVRTYKYTDLMVIFRVLEFTDEEILEVMR